MANMADSLGVKFRMDPMICPTLIGRSHTLAERVDPGSRRDSSSPTRGAEKIGEYLACGQVRHRRYGLQVRRGRCCVLRHGGGLLRPCMMATDM